MLTTKPEMSLQNLMVTHSWLASFETNMRKLITLLPVLSNQTSSNFHIWRIWQSWWQFLANINSKDGGTSWAAAFLTPKKWINFPMLSKYNRTASNYQGCVVFTKNRLLVFTSKPLKSKDENVQKFLNTTYFVACKKWFDIHFLKRLGNEHIYHHL